MKPTNRIYVGGPLLDPPDEPEVCETCGGAGVIDQSLGGTGYEDPDAECPDCQGEDPGEPNDYPEDL